MSIWFNGATLALWVLVLCQFIIHQKRRLIRNMKRYSFVPALAKTVDPVIVVVLVLGLSCAKTVHTNSVGEVYSAYPSYTRWWDEVQECVGVHRNLNDITWVAQESHWWSPYYGRYNSRFGADTIFLLQDRTMSGNIVRHEMIHALGVIVPGHLSRTFARCSGT